MSRFLKNVTGWLGYSRRERRASFILLFIIFLVVTSRFIIPGKKSTISEVSPLVLYKEEPFQRPVNTAKDSIRLFDFDPNIASFEQLTMLGFNERESRTIIKYREKGGHFRVGEDLRKIYGMDSLFVMRLLPFVKIARQIEKRATGPETLKSRSPVKYIMKKTELNSCDSAELEKLPLIGPVLSARITKYRDLLGGYISIEQLSEVYGMTDSTVDIIRPRLTTDSSLVRRININKATFEELIRHPYLERYEVQSILKYRQLKGKINNMEELVDNKILSGIKALRINGYLSFD